MEFNPKLTRASLLFGEIAYAEGDVGLAIKTYEQALKYAPGNPHPTQRLAAWRADADVHRDFEERRYDRFRVMFQGYTDAGLAAQATDMLKWSGGVYDGRIRVPAAGAAGSLQSFERVLTHELTHSMIANAAPRGVPTWLHEGLAQYFEGDDPRAARRRLGAVGRDRLIPLSRLEEGFSQFGAAQAQVAYDESLVAVDVIMQRPAFNWSSLLRALGEHDRTEQIFDSFALSYADLEAQFGR